MTKAEESPLLVQELPTVSGHVIGHLTLNKPGALNALDLTMAQLMLDALQRWRSRDDVLFVYIDGTGDRAFCAGGDVVSMHKAMEREQGTIPKFLCDFFTTEYSLDHTIHCYPKPVIVWGNGVVMGGGMGLLVGASHRVVTQSSRLAMPEITIGLYPDVGGSYFLPRLPGKSGLFLGLTGASLHASDALYLGLANYLCDDGDKTELLAAMASYPWHQIRDVHLQISQLLEDHCLSLADVPESNMKHYQHTINELCGEGDLQSIVGAICNMPDSQDGWLQRAKQTLLAGSPLTAHLVYQQCIRGAHMGLADCFRMELIMSCRCGEYGEFQEGVRALLIDKDRQPRWHYADVSSVPDDVINVFFRSPWPEHSHPLAKLGAGS
ncbi:enoyl-CoA hydratase/isomerase family protein [Alteromonas aestuariivivens]|uniref:3-hydroxyisobutyryl-CoA hydrolase n=1 Tax=Alteromonas aestuariivivens TaxID=1938339 RepID=A0A3D8M8B7_9ALTE|nr:enoyl-CoA hydratase/isomerase family protein [Alteromonas aestuariivivens]RDV26029.1 enoyl-CoA hydratase/isomerase family protein [Alteromonas aestuariivivens]